MRFITTIQILYTEKHRQGQSKFGFGKHPFFHNEDHAYIWKLSTRLQGLASRQTGWEGFRPACPVPALHLDGTGPVRFRACVLASITKLEALAIFV